MRRALALFALLSCALAARADAQQALAQSVTLPTGVTVARSCDKMESEGVVVESIDTRALPVQGAQYLTELAQIIARRVGVRAGSPPRMATYGVLLLRTGEITRRIPVVHSGERDLDMRIDDALVLPLADPDRVSAPASMPDSLRLLVTFGVHDDGSPFVAPHVSCPAVPFPDNAHGVTAAWVKNHPRTLVIHGVITAAGRVDTATALVDDASDERYVSAAMSTVAQMRFVPAEYDGVKVPASIEIAVPFAPPETSADSSEEPAPDR